MITSSEFRDETQNNFAKNKYREQIIFWKLSRYCGSKPVDLNFLLSSRS